MRFSNAARCSGCADRRLSQRTPVSVCANRDVASSSKKLWSASDRSFPNAVRSRKNGSAKPDAKFISISVTSLCSGQACIPKAFEAARLRSADGFIDYCRQGKRAYRIAAEIEGEQSRPTCELLMRLSEQFELCAYVYVKYDVSGNPETVLKAC